MKFNKRKPTAGHPDMNGCGVTEVSENKAGLVTRRGFLCGAAAAGGGLLLSSLNGPDHLVAAQDEGAEHYAMLTDITRCIGCRRCEAACNTTNQLPAQPTSFEDKSVFEEHRRTDDTTYTVVNRYADPRTGGPVYRKIQCNHCLEPACASACPVGALKKSPDGPVLYNEKVCIGCRYCMTACPFYILTFEYDDPVRPAIQKCFMCQSTRIAKGEMPACATECPVEAITFGRRGDLIDNARQRIRNKPNKYIDHIYGEHEAGGLDWLYVSAVPFENLGLPADLGTAPLLERTKEFLSMVPLVLVVWPALLGGFYLASRRRANALGNEASGDK